MSVKKRLLEEDGDHSGLNNNSSSVLLDEDLEGTGQGFVSQNKSGEAKEIQAPTNTF